MNRQDVLRRVRRAFDLLPQLGHEVVDGARGGELLVAPHFVEDLLARHHLPGVLHEIPQQVELACGELDALLAAAGLVQLEIDLDFADADHVGSRLLLSGTPQQAQVGTHNVTLRVNDGTVTVDQSFTITIANVNDAPAFTSTAPTTVNEDVSYNYVALVTDIDGDTLTYTAPLLPTWLS